MATEEEDVQRTFVKEIWRRRCGQHDTGTSKEVGMETSGL